MSDDAVLRRPARMDRRRTEGDHHYRVHVADLTEGMRQGPISHAIRKEKKNLRPMPPLMTLHDMRLHPPAAPAFSPLASHPLSPQSDQSTPRSHRRRRGGAVTSTSRPRWSHQKSPSMLNRRSTLPALLDVNSEALMLSRQLHLDFHEVKFVVQELRRDGRRLSNGGMDLGTFRQILLRVFGYRDHIFNIEATKSQAEQGDGLTLELAKKHNCSCIELDKVKLQFDHFDLDKSGVIDFHEEMWPCSCLSSQSVAMCGTLNRKLRMYELLHCSSKSDLPRNRLLRFWHEADLDQNGVIDFQEFTEWYMKYFGSASPGGIVEAFYKSFMPDVQRTHHLENLIESEEKRGDSKLDTQALKPYLNSKFQHNCRIDIK
eukprot:g20780.t1